MGEASRRQAASRRRIEGAYGAALLLVLAAIWIGIIFGGSARGLLIAGPLQGLALLVVLQVSGARRSIAIAASIAALIATISAAGLTYGNSVFAPLLWALIVLGAIAAMAKDLHSQGAITLRVVLGLLSIYLLVGLLFAHTFQIADAIGSPFFATGQASFGAFVYFSYVTMTTLGYGDLTPAPGWPQALAVTESIMGQLYLVTVVALAVGRLGGARQREERRRSVEAS